MSTGLVTLIVIVGAGALVGLIYLLARATAAEAAKAAETRKQWEHDRATLDAERKGAAVVSEHRTVDDAARRLRDGTF